MKAISIHQPWASLVVTGKKHIETRSWRTDCWGPLLIHASKTLDFLSDLSPLFASGYFKVSDLPYGAIIGKVELVGCFPIQVKPYQVWIFGYPSHMPSYVVRIPPDEPELSFGDYTPGRWAWLFENPVWFETPIPYRGQRGLFEVPDEFVP